MQLSDLNAAQREAVTTTEGFVRVIAGAGSGKTRALAHRFAYLVNDMGILPGNILCVTFTNKAANEMRQRIHRLTGDNDTGYINTFHGFCVSVLQEDSYAVQYPKSFLVLDNADIDDMLKIIYEERKLTLRDKTFSQARDMIEIQKLFRKPEYYQDLIGMSLDALHEKYTISDIDTVLANHTVRKGMRAFLICMGLDMLFILFDFVFSLGGMLSLPAMAILFTTGALLAGYFTGLRGKALFKSFLQGAKTIAPAIPLIVFVLAISYILNEGKIMHTILFHVYNVMEGLSPFTAILLLFGVIALLEFFIGSGTAKAFLIMPLVAPLSDLVGITRQSVVTTFCLADGFTNLLYPTSGIMIIAIGLVGVSYGKWLRWSWKLFLAEFALSALVMLGMVAIHYQ